MFNAIRRMFGKKSEEEIVAFSLLNEWFNTKLKETTIKDELNESFDDISLALRNIQNSLTNISTKTVNGVKEEHAPVLNEHFSSYVSKMTHFIKQLTYRETRDFNAIINYAETLAVSLQEMKEIEEFKAVQKFHSEEAKEIDTSFGMLSAALDKLDSVLRRENGLIYIAGIMKRISSIERKNRRKAELQTQIDIENSKKKEAERYKLKLETDSDNIKTTPEFEKYDRTLSRKINLEKEKERLDAAVKSVFEPIIGLLKEYDVKELGADRALARSYADDCIRAFYSDGRLWVLSLLQSVSSKLPEIEKDENKRMKLRQHIVSISEDSLRQMIAKHQAIESGLREVRGQIVSEMTARKLEDIKYKLNHAEQQIKHFEASIAAHQKEIDELKIEKDLRSLENELSSFAKVKIQ